MKSKAELAQVVQPYAEALMSVAKSNNQTEQFGENVRSLLNLFKESKELSDFFANPFITAADKKAIINRILGEDTNNYFRNFLMLLVDRGRIVLLEGVCQQYLATLREMNQTVLAEITSAVPLTDEQQESIKNKVKTMTSAREVELETSINSDIIGGVIIKVGSQVIDASLRGQLRRLSLALK